MDNTQVTARDGSWFLFGDWQGVTRVALPGDKAKTDSGLDRPHEKKPFVLRDNGMVWLEYAVDVDPVTLKKVRPAAPGSDSPDPLGGADLSVGHAGEKVKVRDQELTFVSGGNELPLGGAGARRQKYMSLAHAVFPDGSLVVFGTVDGKPAVTFVAREADGSGRVAWCRPVACPPNGAPGAFRRGGSVVLTDRDMVNGIAHLVEIREDGAIISATTPAVAGPWVHDGLVWWQPDEDTVCAGAELGKPTERHEIPAEHAGAGRLLRLVGRKLLLSSDGVTVLDLAPAKKGKSEISRKHKAADEPMYRNASRLLRPIAESMARRGVDVRWRGVVRRGKQIEPQIEIRGTADLVTYLLHYSLQDGAAAALAGNGVSSVSVSGGVSLDEVLKPAAWTAPGDIRHLIAALDAAGINRASGFGYLHSLSQTAAQRDLALPWTPEAEALAVAATLSGVRREMGATIPAATPEAFAQAAGLLGDNDSMRKAGISGSKVALFLAVSGHRRFGAEAVAPLMSALEAMNPTFPGDVAKALGLPFTPYVAPVVPEAPLSPEEAAAVGELEKALENHFAVDPAASRESRGWYRFAIDSFPFQAGVNDEALVIGTLCSTDTDVDLRKLGASLKRANKSGGEARFVETDCYIHARATCAMAQADASKWKTLIEACRNAVASEAGSALAIEYGTTA